MKKDLVFFGIQWCGKGTQAKKLLEVDWDQYSYFSSGDVFRALTGTDNAIWNYIKQKLEEWTLIPDDVTINLFRTYFSMVLDSGKFMLLDGYPRTKAQIDDLFEEAKKYDRKFLGVYFDLPEKVAIERMLLRWRNDDNLEAIKYRIQQYYDKTKPIVDYFASKGELVKIDSDRVIEEIAEDVKGVCLVDGK